MDIDNDNDINTGLSSTTFSGHVHVKSVKKIKLDSTPTATEQVIVKLPEKLPLLSSSDSTYFKSLEEYTFPVTDPQTFLKSGKFNTPGEILEILTSTNSQKRDHMATAELCPTVKRPRLTINKGNIKALYGFDLDHHTYLHPEEALYLLETGKLEILTEGVPMSVERGRLLFLQSSQIPSCSATDYIVYKYFAKLGYRLQRKCPEYLSASPPDHTESDLESVEKPMEEEVIVVNDTEGAPSRGTKRRASSPVESDDIQSTPSASNTPVVSSRDPDEATVILDDEDSDCEFIEAVDKGSSTPGVHVTTVDDDFELDEDEVTMDEVFGLGAYGPPSPLPELPYTVVESDSDVEFVDEVCFTGVRIEEISSDDSVLSCEAGPSTSKQSRLPYVDLVSDSEEEEEEEVIAYDHYEPIWAKCVPNSKLKFIFPPAEFLPENILPRSSFKTYEYNLFNEGAQTSSDVEIEAIVDQVRDKVLVSDPINGAGKATSDGSWKDWRENSMAEAKKFFNDSVLGKVRAGEGNGLGGWKWSKKLTESKSRLKEGHDTSLLHMPYDLYPQSAAHVHRNKLGVIVKPIHRIAVVTDEEVIPDAIEFPSTGEEAPLLVTVIGGDSSIVQLLCNNQPIQSLF